MDAGASEAKAARPPSRSQNHDSQLLWLEIMTALTRTRAVAIFAMLINPSNAAS